MSSRAGKILLSTMMQAGLMAVAWNATVPGVGHDWADAGFSESNPVMLPDDGSNENDSYAYFWLTSRPSADVTVTVASSDSSRLRVGDGVTSGGRISLTVLQNEWSFDDTNAYLELDVMEDADVVDDTVTLSFTVTSEDQDYNGLTVESVTVVVTEAAAATFPTLTITGVPAAINSTAAFTATFEFTEAVTGFTAGDVTVTGGTKGEFGGSGTRYTLVVTPTDSADVTVTVTASSVEDGSGNRGPAQAESATAVWDATPPTLTITGVPAAISSTAAFTAAFEFTEAVTGFTAGDVTVTGGEKGAFDGSETEYTLVVTPDGSTNVTVTVSTNALTDQAGNAGPAQAVSVTAAWQEDRTPPTLRAFSVPAGINSTAAFTATFEFTEPVTGFTTDDVTVTGGEKGEFDGSGTDYTLVVTPDDSTDVTVTVRANAATDHAGNEGPATALARTTPWDVDPPMVEIFVPAINSTAAFTATFKFTEAVTGFLANDVTVENGTKGAFSGSSLSFTSFYTLEVTPSDSADVIVTVASSSVADHLGNVGPAQAKSATARWDVTSPGLTITGVPAAISSTAAFTATFEFTEAVTGFTTGDVTVTGGTKGEFGGSGTGYTLEVTPAGTGDVTVTVGAGAATDEAGNAGPAADVSATAVWDATPPGLTITGVPAAISSTAAFTATFEFDER